MFHKKSIPATLVSLAVFATALTVLVAPPPRASAQAWKAALDPALCATTYKPSSEAGARTVADCRTLVAWRNDVVAHADSSFGSGHPMAQWGTGSQTQKQVHNWSNVDFTIIDSQRVLTGINLGWKNMGGPLPGEFPYIRFINLVGNKFTGGIPNWMYGAPNLWHLNIGANRLSGTVTGSAFNAPKLIHLLIQNNRFTGSVPNFNFNNLPLVTDLRIFRNQFFGPIPASWSGLADGRGIQRLQAGSAGLTGNLPSWISNLKFSNASDLRYDVGGKHYLDFSGNKLCIPSDFVFPEYKRLDGTDAPLTALFGNNDCPTEQSGPMTLASSPRNIEFDAVDGSGTPTQTNPVGLKVTWDKPSTVTGSVGYTVRLRLISTYNENYDAVNDEYTHCPGDNLVKNIPATPAASGDYTFTLADCTLPAGQRASGFAFDPTIYGATVSTSVIGAATFEASSAISNYWSFYVADNPSNTYAQAARWLQVRKLWLWDPAYQVWQEVDSGSANLEVGTVLAAQSRVPESWMERAGVSAADENTPIQLQNGWNLFGAGGSAARPVDSNGAFSDPGAFFIDSGLMDCDSLQGVIAIYRYDTANQRFDVELPCHPSTEATMTRGGGIGNIDDLELLDSLYVYFRSALPVCVAWDEGGTPSDDTDNKYVPSSGCS